MQVSESTEIIYDKNVVNFSGNDEQCVRSTQKVCTKYPIRPSFALSPGGSLL